MKKALALSFAAALTVGWTVSAPAAEAARTLDPIVVTADRSEEKASAVTRAVTVVSREELEKNQYQDLRGLLQQYGFAGLGYGGSGQSTGSIQIRGMKTSLLDNSMTSPILVLLDGRPAGTAILSTLPLVSVERVEVVRGPASVQYGTTAMGGVVNVITKRGGKDPKVSLELGGGSWHTGKAEAAASGSWGALDFAGGFAYTTAHDYQTGAGHTWDNTGLNRRTSYVLNLGFTPLEEHRLGVALVGTQTDKAGNPGEQDYYNYHGAYTDRSSHSVDVTYDGGARDAGLNWKLRYYNTRDTYTFDDHGYDEYPATPLWSMFNDYQSESRERNQGMQAQLTWKRGFLTVTGGMDWLDNRYRTGSVYYGTYSTNGETKVTDTAGFLLAKAALFGEKLVLSAGARHDSYTLKYQGSNKDDDKTTWSAGAIWNVMDWLAVRANYGTSFRMPSGMQVAGYYDSASWHNYIGNSDLKPEQGKGWDAGVAINWNALDLGVTYFQTRYEDKIVTRTVGSSNQFYNLDGKTTFRGIEAQAGLDLGALFDWSFLLRPYVNLTHLLKYEDEQGNTLKDVRNNNVAYGVGFAMPGIGLTADLRLTYFGHIRETDYRTYETIKTGGFTTADFFVSKTLYDWEDRGKLSIKGALCNIFDKDYATVRGYPQPGRSFYVALRYDY